MTFFNSNNKGLTNKRSKEIERSVQKEIIKGRDAYLENELKKYRNLDIQVYNNDPKKK